MNQEKNTIDQAVDKLRKEENEGIEEKNSTTEKKLVYIPIDKLYPHPDNPRKDLGDLSELTDSIISNGVMQNLIVIRGINSTPEYDQMLDGKTKCSKAYRDHAIVHAFKGDYTVVIGHRRHAAAVRAGLKELPCIITEMDYPTQISTMMTENLQRVDLTVYEQAQGFRQLSLDFGMSVDTIAEKTGFSPSTVRRRLKLGELNQDTLKEVSARQISLADLDKLSDIKDPKTRDKVLESIGTNNFESAYLSAKNKQNRDEKEQGWRTILLNNGCIELANSEKYATKYQHEHYLSCPPDEKILLDKMNPDMQYYFYIDWGTVYLKTLKANVETIDPEKKKKEMEEAKRRDAANALKDAFERAFTLRTNFIKNYTEADAKKHLLDILRLGVELNQYDGGQNVQIDLFSELIGFSKDEIKEQGEAGPNWFELEEKNVQTKTCKALLCFVYACTGDEASKGCYESYLYCQHYGEYDQDDDYGELQTIYDNLERLGYEMSDEEKALMDGTSELYYKDEEDEDEINT